MYVITYSQSVFECSGIANECYMLSLDNTIVGVGGGVI